MKIEIDSLSDLENRIEKFAVHNLIQSTLKRINCTVLVLSTTSKQSTNSIH